MKSNLRIFPAMLLVMTLLSSCMYMGNTIMPSKTIITRDYKVEEFKKIDIGAVGDIYYTQSPNGKTTVQISGPDNYIALFKVAVKDSTLLINTPEGKNLSKSKNITINISTPRLNGICVKGVGNLYIKDELKTDYLDIATKGVGDVEISSLACRNLDIQSTGVGNVAAQGVAKSATFHSSGVGNIEAEGLQADSVKAVVTGVGNISCYAVKTLNATAKGVGNIKYKGDPSVRLESKGIGSINRF